MNRFYRIRVLPDVIGCWLLATLALCLGLLFNQFRDAPLPLVYKTKAERMADSVARIEGSSKEPTETSSGQETLPTRLSLGQFRDLVEGKRCVILDARPEIFHRSGHVPGAISLPRDDFESQYRRHQELLEKDKGQTLAVYCSNKSCEDSVLVESALRALGYTRISIFEGGWTEWLNAGLTQEVAE